MWSRYLSAFAVLLLIVLLSPRLGAVNPTVSAGPLSGGARVVAGGAVQVYCYRNTGTPQKPIWFLAQNTLQFIDGETGAALVHYQDPATGTLVTWLIWRPAGSADIRYQGVAATQVVTGPMAQGVF